MKTETILCLLALVLLRRVLANAHTNQWVKMAQEEIDSVLNRKPNNNVAKNVIFFLGDGMGVSTVTGGRIYKGQTEGHSGEETVLSFERFHHLALIKTYNVDRQTPDSAGTATAFMCGVKANFGTLGVDETVKLDDCKAQAAGKVPSLLKWSRDAGKSVGVVTTTRVTHATPAAGYAHSASRNWEGDYDITAAKLAGQCKDIAQQLIDNMDIQVVMGGGRRVFLLNNQTDPGTGLIDKRHRKDGRDLIKEWTHSESRGDKKAEYVWNKAKFDAVDPEKTDYLLGLFATDNMSYEIDRDKTGAGEPSLAEMTAKAIQILRKNDKGYFLFVEAGRIDHAHHDTMAKRALHDVVALDEAVSMAIKMTNQEDTLVVVTADHSHVFNIGGYPFRGNDILGKVKPFKDGASLDGMPKTTIVYGNGPAFKRVNITNVDTTRVDYQFQGAVGSKMETHGGEDVAVYAEGPMAHLFHGVHEQSYIAHAMAYASCVGINTRHCDETGTANGGSEVRLSYFTTFSIGLFACYAIVVRIL